MKYVGRNVKKDEQSFSHEELFYQEDKMTAKFVETHSYRSTSNAIIQLHSHPFHEIIYCRSGKDIEYMVGSSRYFLQKGDIVLIPSGVSHRPLLSDSQKEPYERETLWLSREFVESILCKYPVAKNLHEKHGYLLRTAGTEWEIIGEYFHSGVKEAKRGAEGWEISVIGNTLQILPLIYRAATNAENISLSPEKSELIDGVMNYIEKNLRNKISLSEVAKQFFVSESTLSHTFKSRMGVSFYRLVTQSRLAEAKRMLLGDDSMDEISRASGFDDYSTFYRAFRQEYGISPSEYRKSLHLK